MDINPQKLKNRVDDWIVLLATQNVSNMSLKDIKANTHLLIDQQLEEEQEEMAENMAEEMSEQDDE